MAQLTDTLGHPTPPWSQCVAQCRIPCKVPCAIHDTKQNSKKKNADGSQSCRRAHMLRGWWLMSQVMYSVTMVSTVDLGKVEICVGLRRGRQGMKNKLGMPIMVRLVEGQSSPCSTTFLYIWSCSG